MADNLKPYDPNKGFISFRLNPDAIKEELISFVPYNRTLRHIYNNPEGDIRETAKVAASETPILGSLLAGEPVDAAKEAFLFGMPIKYPNNAKKAINKLPSTTQFKPEKYSDGITTMIAHDPKTNSTYEVFVNRDNKLQIEQGWKDINDFKANTNKSYNATQVNDFIDKSNDLHKLNKGDNLKFNGGMQETPFESMYNEHIAPIDAEMLDAANNIRLTDKYKVNQAYNWDKKYKDITEQINLKPNESLAFIGEDPYNLFVYNSKTNKATAIQGNGWKSDKYRRDRSRTLTPEIGTQIIPFNGQTESYFRDKLNGDIKMYNAKYQFEDNYIPYNNRTQYEDELEKAKQDYLNSIYGPYYEDILGIERGE